MLSHPLCYVKGLLFSGITPASGDTLYPTLSIKSLLDDAKVTGHQGTMECLKVQRGSSAEALLESCTGNGPKGPLHTEIP